MKRWHPLWQLLLVRLREFYREPAVLFWVYGFPLFLAIGLGVAFSGGVAGAFTGGEPGQLEVDIEEPPRVNSQRTPARAEADALCQQLRDGGLDAHLRSAAECRWRLGTGKAALVITPDPQGYRYAYDPRRPGSLTTRYRADSIVQRWKCGRSAWPTTDVPVEERGGRYIDFLIPGLMGLNLMGGGLWGVGYVIVDMRVRKLLKRFLATPMRRGDFLLAVLASRVAFVVPEMLFLALAGCLVFGMPLRGDLLTLVVVILAGGVAFAGLGLLLASRTEKTETVSGLIQLLVLPMWMLAGTFFPSSQFPEALQQLIRVLPLTPLNDALREVILEGASLADVSGKVLVLAGWAVVSFLLALKWFRWL
jgi:ABC transporter DrrB family efflux protein